MKKLFLRALLFAICILAVLSPKLHAQVSSVVSSAGYIVQLNILPTNVVPTSASCTWGYNYNVKLNYNVGFSGSNIPASLYTLQGTIGCGSSSHFFDLPNNGGVGTVSSTSNQWNSASDCATASLISLHCNTANIQISGPGIANQTVSFPITYSTLPVKITLFKASMENDRVKIEWNTATEINSNEFVVERSLTGNAWTPVKSVKAAGNSTALLSYESFDDHPYPGANYYRLREVDFDGKETLSEVRAIQYDAAKSAPSIYPIPNTGRTIHIRNITNYSDYQLVMKNLSGSVVFKTDLKSDVVQLPVLKAGIYMVGFTNSKVDTTKYIRYIQL